MELWTALTIGLLGSFHCAGMCGPIAFSLPLDRTSFWSKSSGNLVYNTGRIFTYALMGVVFGTFGKGLMLAGLQQSLSVTLGVLILLSVLTPLLFKKRFASMSWVYLFVGKLKNKLRQLFAVSSYSSLLLIGMLNGLLPCGLVYLGIAGAIGTGDALAGGAYMALFGLGTLPVMYGVALAGNMISLSIRNKIKKAIPVFVALLGILFILRGMNLGVPYLSPQFDKEEATVHKCH